MAAVGKAEGDFSGVIPKAEHCEMWSRSESSKWEGRRNGSKKKKNAKKKFKYVIPPWPKATRQQSGPI